MVSNRLRNFFLQVINDNFTEEQLLELVELISSEDVSNKTVTNLERKLYC